MNKMEMRKQMFAEMEQMLREDLLVESIDVGTYAASAYAKTRSEQ